MRRRSIVLATGTTALGSTLGSVSVFGQPAGQTAKKLRRVGLLTPSDEASFAGRLQAVLGGLSEQGFVAGREIAFDARYASGRPQELTRLAAELAALKPAVIIALGASATNAALAAAAGVPIVSLGDLVAAGHATQLARPDRGVTGVSFLPALLNAKRLELLAELLPRGSAVLNLVDQSPLPGAIQMVEDAARLLGLVTHLAKANSRAEIEAAFTSARRLRVAAVNVLNSPFLHAQRARIIELAASARLPAIYQWPETARDGGLMGYGPSVTTMFRQLGGYAARILDGAKPADLPIEQPTRFELVINLKTARALGITIPRLLRLRAEEVIE